MRRFFILSSLLLAVSCGSLIVNRADQVTSYAARASWQWETAKHFLIRGRARLEGENQVFSGPFMLWASREVPAVRADFCGPDGSPLISIFLDPDGCLIYKPEEADAFYVIGGMPAGSGYLEVNAVISLLRTGFPSVPVQWKIVESCDTTASEENRWLFLSSAPDTAVVSLKPSHLFPLLNAGDFSLEATASSWHDEFNAWPMEWRLGSNTVNAIIRIRSYDTGREPAEAVWNMVVPVPVDTVYTEGGPWRYAFDFPVR